MSTDVILSEVESRHFGVRIGRCTWRQADDVASSRAVAATRQIGLLVARCDAADFATIRAATAAGCFAADVLVELSGAPDQLAVVVPAGVAVRAARPADAAQLVELAGAAFAAYPGHYRHDPYLAAHLSDALYTAWLRDALQIAAQPATPLLIAERAGALVGACVLQQLPDALDVRLMAVAPVARGSGVFDALIAAVAALAAQRGLARIRYTTQLNNLAAQRAAQRCGLRSSGAQVTYHCRLEMPAAMEEML